MSRAVAYLVGAIVLLAVLVSAGPTLVALAEAAVPLVIAVSAAAIALRLVWHYTRNY